MTRSLAAGTRDSGGLQVGCSFAIAGADAAVLGSRRRSLGGAANGPAPSRGAMRRAVMETRSAPRLIERESQSQPFANLNRPGPGSGGPAPA